MCAYGLSAPVRLSADLAPARCPLEVSRRKLLLYMLMLVRRNQNVCPARVSANTSLCAVVAQTWRVQVCGNLGLTSSYAIKVYVLHMCLYDSRLADAIDTQTLRVLRRCRSRVTRPVMLLASQFLLLS